MAHPTTEEEAAGWPACLAVKALFVVSTPSFEVLGQIELPGGIKCLPTT